MRLAKKSHLVLVVLLVTGLFAASAATGSQTKARATVSVTGSDPLTVTGAGFAPRERVTVRVAVSGDAASKVLRATRKGRFVAQFPGVSAAAEGCTSNVVTVTATGARSRASMRGRTIPPPCGFDPQP
jgi:hypothetical protein